MPPTAQSVTIKHIVSKARGWKMGIYSFQRWASDDFGPIESRAWSKRRPYLWVLQALYLPHTGLQDWPKVVPMPVRRLHGPALHPKGHLPKSVRYTYGLMLYWAKIARTHREPGERMCQLHRRTPMAPQVLRAGAHPWVSSMRHKH